ncbi:unnamed protein product, partial [Mesorhabditis spiculigera]
MDLLDDIMGGMDRQHGPKKPKYGEDKPSPSARPEPANVMARRIPKSSQNEFGSPAPEKQRNPGFNPQNRGGGFDPSRDRRGTGPQQNAIRQQPRAQGSGWDSPSSHNSGRNDRWGAPLKEEFKSESGYRAGTSTNPVYVGENEVEASMYEIDITKTVPKVIKLQIEATLFRGEERNPIDLTVQPKNASAVNRKMRGLSGAVDLMLELIGVSEEDKWKYIYDAGNAVYTCVAPQDFAEEKVCKFRKEQLLNPPRPEVIQFFGQRWEFCELRMRLVKLVPLRQIGDDFTSESMTFFDILTNAPLIKAGYSKFGRDWINMREHPEELKARKSGMVMRTGFEKSVSAHGNKLMLNFRVCKKPCFKGQTLVDYLMATQDARCPRDLDGLLRDRAGRKNVSRQIKNLYVKTTHMLTESDQRQIFLFQLHDKSANQETFDNDGRQTTVAEYFQDKYLRTLKFPDLPLVASKRGNNITYFPLEVLVICEDQSLSKDRIGVFQKEVVEKGRFTPADFSRVNRQQFEDSGLSPRKESPYLKTFGVSIHPEPMMVKSQKIIRPDIVTKNVVDPVRAGQDGSIRWNTMAQMPYAEPIIVPRTLVLNYNRAVRDMRSLEGAIEQLRQHARVHKMRWDEPPSFEEISHMDRDGFVEFLAKKKHHGFGFVLLISGEDPEAHGGLKYGEQEVCISTQNILPKTLGLGGGGGGRGLGNDTKENIIKKMNLKLGGVNYSLAVPGSINKFVQEHVFSKERMYIGFAMSHPGAQALHDRINKAEIESPTTIGMSFTTAHATVYRGRQYCQQSRQTIVQNLRAYISDALQQYEKEAKRLPAELFIYRDGVSDGQFEEVLNTEVHGPTGLLKTIAPNMTVYYVIARESSEKLIPANVERLRDRKVGEQNIPAGTAITIDDDKEYLTTRIISQRSIIGTARVSKYTLLFEKIEGKSKKMTKEELNFVTNALANGSGISTASTSLPAPLFNARKHAERADEQYKYLSGDAEHRRDGTSDICARVSKITLGDRDFAA